MLLLRTDIEACFCFPYHLSYDREKQALYDRFERKHFVTRELIIDLVNHKPVRFSADDLNDLTIKQRYMCATLEQTGYMSDVNLEIIV